MKSSVHFAKLSVAVACLFSATVATATTYTNVFFTNTQTATLVSSNINAVTIQSGDYRFTYSVDGYWSPSPGGPPTGRFFSVLWPMGVQAQAITVGPLLGTGANITIKRADGKPFDVQAFTGKILANTAGAGGAFEITPQLNGNDDPNAPYMYDATGFAGQSFSYTPMFHNYDAYKIHLWVDWAVTALTLIDTNPPIPPSTNFTITASGLPAGVGSVGGAGIFASNSSCSLVATANPGWGFKNWTENGTQVSSSANYLFTVRSNRTLAANFIPAFTVTNGVSPAYGGSVSGGGTFNSNALVAVTATPISGFRFVNWTEYGSLVSTSASYNFNISSDRSLVANFAPAGVAVTFDFDTATPAVGPGQGLPATQTKNGVTASFSTLAYGWSVQNTFYGWKPSVFSGNFLYPDTWGSALAVEFSQPVTNFTMAFFTGEVASEYDTAALVRVTAYTNSTTTNVAATGTARGAWVDGAYPSGVLSFGSATPFTKVNIEVPSQSPAPSYLVFVDNLIVQPAAPAAVTINASVMPAGAGIVSGAGDYLPGDSVAMQAAPNGSFHFAKWTEGGVEVSASSIYFFNATTNRTLVANFTANQPPFAFGGTFFQLAGQPLAINLADLMWNDYDPDGDPVTFVSVSATTSNGLPLTTNELQQILVPTNSVADSFSYTIADSFGATATGTGTIVVTNNPAGRILNIQMNADNSVSPTGFGVPWYAYELQRATDPSFSGPVRTWVTRAWPDGTVWELDDFADLGGRPTKAFYRLVFKP